MEGNRRRTVARLREEDAEGEILKGSPNELHGRSHPGHGTESKLLKGSCYKSLRGNLD